MDLTILGRKVPVRFVASHELNKKAGEDLLGYFDGHAIFISSELDSERTCRTLLHEICHAILVFTGQHGLMKRPQEEAICEAFEGLLELFRNEQLLTFLNNRETE